MKKSNLRAASLMYVLGFSLAACGGGNDTNNSLVAAGVTAGSSSSNATNHAPIISGSPEISVLVGSSYNFTPIASDADGDTLAFSIENKPSWATFNTVAGTLSGKPTVAGIYSNIVIRVSDGKATTSLSTFSITVAPISASITLSWTPPVRNTDGSTLLDLAGYTIYYGTNSNFLGNSINVTSATATNHTVTGLSQGSTYYFAVAAVNAAGTSSSLSGLVSETL